MKKLYLIAAMAIATISGNAQEKLMLSTYNGTNVEKYDGKICNVTVNRYMFTGWNTIALPFDVSADELTATFGSDCKLERLVSAENVGDAVQLNFIDCKADGMQANTPYILYYAGEASNKKLTKEAQVINAQALTSVSTQRGDIVTMAGVQAKTSGIGFYGILAKDNAEARFAKVDASLSGFLATRCYVQLNGSATQLLTKHLNPNEITSINAIARNGEKVDVYNVNGVRVASVRTSEVSNLQPGIYVVKGQKVLVK